MQEHFIQLLDKKSEKSEKSKSHSEQLLENSPKGVFAQKFLCLFHPLLFRKELVPGQHQEYQLFTHQSIVLSTGMDPSSDIFSISETQWLAESPCLTKDATTSKTWSENPPT